ncbi:MAG: hypothetical protein SH809_02565 [Rhodothermales bacterium]|nr:hypothetical protein [Rhodothermales bacterium]
MHGYFRFFRARYADCLQAPEQYLPFPDGFEHSTQAHTLGSSTAAVPASLRAASARRRHSL